MLPDGRHDFPVLLTLASEMGWTPQDFWCSTPCEFACALEGFAKRLEHQQELAAWHAANVMQMWTKKSLSVDRLLGREMLVFESKDEFREFMRKRVRKAAKDE